MTGRILQQIFPKATDTLHGSFYNCEMHFKRKSATAIPEVIPILTKKQHTKGSQDEDDQRCRIGLLARAQTLCELTTAFGSNM